MRKKVNNWSLRRCAFASILLAAVALPSRAEVVMPTLSWTPSNSKATISGNIATISIPGSTPASSRISTTFDMSGFVGKAFELTVNAQLSGVGNTTYNWDGLKFQFGFHDDLRGKDNNIDGSLPQKAGTTSGWIQLKLRFDPSQYRTTTATLGLGIQHATGTARFDLSTLAIHETPAICEPTNENLVVSYPQGILDMPPKKGVMSPTGDMNEGDFRTLHEWGATLLRFEMANCPSASITNIPAYLSWLRGRLDHLERIILPCAEKYGLKVVVDLHNTVGGRVGGYTDFALFDDDEFYGVWLGIWREIATRFCGDTRIYGYDLCNEPRQTLSHKRNYWQIQQAAAEAIREIDPDVTIVMEADAMDAPDAFFYLSPLSLGNVIYQVHMYEPGTYTHQGLDSNPYGQEYPGTLPNGATFDKAWLRSQLAPVRAFQLKHNARILVGEFSAICWAPGADQYLKDLTDIYDEYGWDWCYMAFRAWEGWSLEHQEREVGTRWDFVASPDNARKRAILAAYARGAASETVSDYLRLAGGQTVTLNNVTNDDSAVVKRIVFAGGSLRGTSFNGRQLCTANGARWRLESEEGAPILIGDIGVQRFHWHTGDGFVETRGNCDVVIYTTSYHDTYGRGIVWLDDNRIVWDHTGNFVLSNAVKVVCNADYCLPHGNDTGGIWFKRQRGDLPPPLLDLNGHCVAVNAIRADPGGVLTNSASACATVRLGENGMTGMIAGAASLPFHCANVNLVKTGSGLSYLDVKGSAEFGDVRVESGSFTVRDTSGAAGVVEVDTVSVSSNATLVVKDTTVHAMSYALGGGEIELQGTGRFIYDALVVEKGAPLTLADANECAAVRLRDTLTLASGGSVASGASVVVDGPEGGIAVSGGTLPSSSRLSLAPDMEADAEYATVLDLRSGTTTIQCATNANPAVAARVLFSGGTMRGTSFSGTPFCSADGGKWILEGSADSNIVIGELQLQRISWLTGDGSIETRGDCDVVIYDNQYQSANQLSGIVYFNTSNALWNHTGDLVLSNGVRAICRADDCLPCGPQTGDIVLARTNFQIPAPFLDLNGHSVAVNGIRVVGGGIVTNTSAAVATIAIGVGGGDGEISNLSLSGGNIALVKRGGATNVISVATSEFASLRVEEGALLVTGANSDVLKAARVSVGEGATLILDGVSLDASEVSGRERIVSVGGGEFTFEVKRSNWFRASAQGNKVVGGRWIEQPVAEGDRYLLEKGDAVFLANAARRNYPCIDTHLTVVDAWPRSMVDMLAADAARAGARACLIPVKNDGDGQTWFGLVGDGAGRGVFVPLTGHDAACGDYCIAVEFCESSGASGPMQLVSYLVAGSGEPSAPVRLRSQSGATWFPANGSDVKIYGGVHVSGAGDLFEIHGSAADLGTVLLLR